MANGTPANCAAVLPNPPRLFHCGIWVAVRLILLSTNELVCSVGCHMRLWKNTTISHVCGRWPCWERPFIGGRDPQRSEPLPTKVRDAQQNAAVQPLRQPGQNNAGDRQFLLPVVVHSMRAVWSHLALNIWTAVLCRHVRLWKTISVCHLSALQTDMSPVCICRASSCKDLPGQLTTKRNMDIGVFDRHADSPGICIYACSHATCDQQHTLLLLHWLKSVLCTLLLWTSGLSSLLFPHGSGRNPPANWGDGTISHWLHMPWSN